MTDQEDQREDQQEPQLRDIFAELGPSTEQRSRMQSAVSAALAASQTSLVDEWIALLRVRPVANTSYAIAASVLLILTTPAGAVVMSLLRS